MATSAGMWALVGALAFGSGAVHGDGALAQLEVEQQELFERVAPAVVLITASSSVGSGFIVSRDGLVLTNAHVVGKNKMVKVVTHGGKRYTAAVLQALPKVDLALVQLPLAKTTPLPLAPPRALRVGAWVGAVGHGTGGVWTYNTGMVSNIYPAKGQRPVFQTQIPLNPGNSGGPVFDRHGRVVGIVTAGVMEANNVNYAIRIDVALSRLTQLGGRCECVVVHTGSKGPILLDGAMVGQGPRIVLPVEPGKHEVSAVIQGKHQRRRFTFPGTREINLSGGSKR